MIHIIQTIGAILVCVAVLSIRPAMADDYAIDWWTIDGGGEMFSTGDDFELSGTIGQPDAGVLMTGGDFELAGGCWAAKNRSASATSTATTISTWPTSPNCWRTTGPRAGPSTKTATWMSTATWTWPTWPDCWPSTARPVRSGHGQSK